jgi:hypothetical protein
MGWGLNGTKRKPYVSSLLPMPTLAEKFTLKKPSSAKLLPQEFLASHQPCCKL